MNTTTHFEQATEIIETHLSWTTLGAAPTKFSLTDSKGNEHVFVAIGGAIMPAIVAQMVISDKMGIFWSGSMKDSVDHYCRWIIDDGFLGPIFTKRWNRLSGNAVIGYFSIVVDDFMRRLDQPKLVELLKFIGPAKNVRPR